MKRRLTAYMLQIATSMICAAMCLRIAVARAGAHPTPAASVDAESIFEKARDYWDAQSYPHHLQYTIVVGLYKGNERETNHYEAEYLPEDGDLRVNTISAEENANPPSARGTDVIVTLSILGRIFYSKTLNAVASPDLIGIPLLSPTYSFGMARRFKSTRDEGSRTSTDLPLIGRVSNRTRFYVITYAGTDEVAGYPQYHLTLRPIRAPHKYRLRELWIDARSYATDRAIIEGNFNVGPGVDAPWTIDFYTVAGALYIDRERCDEPLQFGKNIYRNISVSFQSLKRTSAMPSLRFVLPQNSDNAISEPDTP
ncbi:MAG: hypothetical protein JO060_05440 [Candidatus Eremiobacteraeota bacterium]|nr:hypothetical protein [Candidatus Eremiobacteraeota bacterium]